MAERARRPFADAGCAVYERHAERFNGVCRAKLAAAERGLLAHVRVRILQSCDQSFCRPRVAQLPARSTP